MISWQCHFERQRRRYRGLESSVRAYEDGRGRCDGEDLRTTQFVALAQVRSGASKGVGALIRYLESTVASSLAYFFVVTKRPLGEPPFIIPI